MIARVRILLTLRAVWPKEEMALISSALHWTTEAGLIGSDKAEWRWGVKPEIAWCKPGTVTVRSLDFEGDTDPIVPYSYFRLVDAAGLFDLETIEGLKLGMLDLYCIELRLTSLPAILGFYRRMLSRLFRSSLLKSRGKWHRCVAYYLFSFWIIFSMTASHDYSDDLRSWKYSFDSSKTTPLWL